MPRGVNFPTALGETAVHISAAAFKPEDNCLRTEVSDRHQSQIFKVLKETGSVVPQKKAIDLKDNQKLIRSFGNPA